MGRLTVAVPGPEAQPPERAAGVAALGAVLAVVGSVLPDVDYPGRGVRGPWGQVARGRPALAAATPLTWPLAVVLYRAWGHRGPTHAPVWAPPLLGLLLAGALLFAGAARGDVRALALGLAGGFLAVGVLAHILQDALTPMGCPLLWPLRPLARRYRLRPLAWAVALPVWLVSGAGAALVALGLLLARGSRWAVTVYRRGSACANPAAQGIPPPRGPHRGPHRGVWLPNAQGAGGVCEHQDRPETAPADRAFG